ncbi:hypothetical protein [Clostridium botulinum]|uniref:hypothetical protein n=1 Tax=Clostridium botulinum TaxID=1491 RepID=UPI0017486140|nr:hypothetical protein [Clostridium botulinum]MBD5589235.1 hypothetical protein [Clostridium botulinum]
MRKPKVKNKYNLKFSDIKKLKINNRSKICEPLFWRNNMIEAWCISENTMKNNLDIVFGTYNVYWLGIHDEDSKKKQKIEICCTAYGGMVNYNFEEFFNYREIENEDDLEIQEKLLKKINQLIDKKILVLP